MNAGNVVKVLIVDDSPFMRRALERILDHVDDVRVVGSARDGLEALEMVRHLRPDVVTLDVEMPKLNGLETLKLIMKEVFPVPCIMVSSYTIFGADITLNALEAGAIDFITKPSSLMGTSLNELKRDLVEKIMVAAKIPVTSLVRRGAAAAKAEVKKPLPVPLSRKRGVEVVMIGISTGGPPALQQVIPQLPENFPSAVVVVQHMPPGFTKSMADRLNKCSAIEVKEADEGDLVLPGRVLVARAGLHLVFAEKYGKKVVQFKRKDDTHNYAPSVDMMFESAGLFRAKSLPVIMTGMGRDGTEGLRKLKNEGVFAMAQSKESCVVYGMPKAAIEEGLIDRIVPLDDMVQAIMEEM